MTLFADLAIQKIHSWISGLFSHL